MGTPAKRKRQRESSEKGEKHGRGGQRSAPGAPAAGLIQVLLLGPLLGFVLLARLAPDLHYRLAQEDQILEWASFWAFALAAGVCAAAAFGRGWRRAGGPWYPLVLAGFCALVALEEISWGQRLLGYRPPPYFLEHNFQQELNVHNVLGKELRRLALQAVLLLWGVLLPLAGALSGPARRLARAGITAPPLELAPGLLAASLVYAGYALEFTGEAVELVLGLGMLVAGLALWLPVWRAGAAWKSPVRRAGALLAAALLTTALGAGSTLASQRLRAASPEAITAAEAELVALRRDLLAFGRGPGGEPAASGCGLHRRVYTYAKLHRGDALSRGAFASLVAQGLPEARAEFFLDPWNGPYWIRDTCSEDGARRSVFLYSFGPNFKRDSSPWALGGDDVGALVYSKK